jgi:YidC/Oxa1 family membrane protein insertase
MDNFRLILILALFFILLMLYQAWQEDYGHKSPNNVPKVGTSTTTTPETATPTTTADSEWPTPLEKAKPAATGVPDHQTNNQLHRVLPSGSRIQVETDVLKLEIDTVGGDVRQVDLPTYPVAVDSPQQPFRLLSDELPIFLVAQSGLLPADQAPTHQAIYSSEQSSYRLNDQANELEVKLHWQNDKGLKVTKSYLFQRGSHTITLKYLVDNGTTSPWQGQVYGQLQRTETSIGQSHFVYTYLGGAISSPSKHYEKIAFAEMSDGSFTSQNRPGWAGGWVAMIQHYFVAAFVPEREPIYHYYTKVLDGTRYVLGLYGPSQTVAPGTQQVFNLKLYVGPKLQHTLAALAPSLDLTVDYGWLWFIAQPLFWMLETIHQLVGNWGWAIIILTIMVKLAFFHLSATSYKSMANMRRLQPRLMTLKERYGEDKAKLNQAMMDLYKKEKINPLGGCLPILIQIPVFISLYWVLLESVELRQASFMWWWKDLSTPDPYFVLPLVMGVTMLIQHFLNPAPIDPVQQKVMMVLPIVFTVFFAFFPSGLVLYWLINNLLSITQQWVITKKIVQETK